MPVLAGPEEDWERGFRSPPPECRPEVFWDWMGGLVSKEGITKDLEALAGAGVGGVMIMQMPDQLAGTVQWRLSRLPGQGEVPERRVVRPDEPRGQGDRPAGAAHVVPDVPRLEPLRRAVDQAGEGAQDPGGLAHARWPAPTVSTRCCRGRPIHKPTGGSTAVAGQRRRGGLGAGAESARGFLPRRGRRGRARGGRGRDRSAGAESWTSRSRWTPQGRLAWEAPPGKWTVLRLGVASENGPNHPAPPEAMGLECDRMDPAAVRLVFDGMTARIVREARAKGYKSVQRFETDSYEGGRQDFGLDFQAEFRKRRGYDCTPWLPAWLDANLVIGNADLSERFRADMLRTISELWIERFYGELRRLADENDLQWMIEPYFLMNHDWRTAAARAHVPGSEFWMGGPQLIGPAPDTAALYGQKVVWAEAFTAESEESAWRNDPWRMKPYGDAAYCQGINHFIMHGFTHNPCDDRYPARPDHGLLGHADEPPCHLVALLRRLASLPGPLPVPAPAGLPGGRRAHLSAAGRAHPRPGARYGGLSADGAERRDAAGAAGGSRGSNRAAARHQLCRAWRWCPGRRCGRRRSGSCAIWLPRGRR